MRRSMVLGSAFAVAALVFGLLAPAANAAPNVTCGETITTDLVMNTTLDCPGSGVALRIGADNVTLDMNGHAIRGTFSEGSTGIRAAGVDKGEIINGVVTGFEDGIDIEVGVKWTLTELTVHDNGTGIAFFGVSNSEISEVHALRNFDAGVYTGGPQATPSTNNKIHDSFMNDNCEFGLYIGGNDTKNQIAEIEAVANSFGVAVAGDFNKLFDEVRANRNAFSGIILAGDFNKLDQSSASGNGTFDEPVGCFNNNPDQVETEEYIEAFDGILVEGQGNLVTRNTVANNIEGFNVVVGGSGNGIDVFGPNNVFKKNRVPSNEGNGIYVGSSGDNTFSNNFITNNGEDGMLVNSGGNLLEKNASNGNGDDGFDVPNENPNTLNKNTANTNNDAGIYAPAANGNGNHADGNGGTNCTPGAPFCQSP